MRPRRPIAVLLSLLALAGLSPVFAKPPRAPVVDDHVTAANLVRVTTKLLEQSQFSHHPLNRELARKWLERYLDALDSRHSLFLDSDVEEFSTYLPTMAEVTLDAGKTSIPHRIFARYLERMEQQTSLMTGALKTDSFTFAGHDRYRLDWDRSPRPRDLAAAQSLWRQQLRAEYLQEKLGDRKRPDIVKLLTRRHTQQLKTMRGLRSEEIMETYLDSLAHVYDPHSNYLGHEEMESMSIAMNLSLVGIGASLQTVDGYCTVRELIPGGPGARSGKLKPGDRIIAVAQGKGEPVDVVDIPLTRTVQMIRGKKGTAVTLTILPASASEGAPTRTLTLIRDVIKLEDQAAQASIVEFPRPDGGTTRLGIVDLPSFYADIGTRGAGGQRSSADDVRRLLGKLNAEHVRGLVFDLRRNGGGALEESIRLTGLFIRKGPVVQTRDLQGRVEVEADEDPAVQYDGPMIVLTSRFSASASEILAGALQDYGRAVLVGDTATFGKGTVQSIVPLAPLLDDADLAYAYQPGALLVTIRKFYRPSGASTQLRGVIPDIVLPSLSDLADVSESSLPDPLPWDAVEPAPYESVGQVRPYLAALRAASAARVKKERGFAVLAQAIARVQQDLATKSVSLNEAERRADAAKAKALEKQLEEEGRKLRARQPRTYPITLANASLRGLPPPAAPARPKTPRQDAASETDEADGEPGERSAAEEIILEESERILVDYIRRTERSRPTRSP
jgi:carboxyl-terminal processing protease